MRFWGFGHNHSTEKKTTSPNFIDISRSLCWFAHVHLHYPTDIQQPLWIICCSQIKTCSDQSRRLLKSSAGTSGGLQRVDPLIFLNLRGNYASHSVLSQVNMRYSHPSMLTHFQWINMPKTKTRMRKSQKSVWHKYKKFYEVYNLAHINEYL